ncbi:phosphatase PAP2 family protein [Peribacillus glennii]|uniref:phosphatase PAP2 family protein n=1 Tax=Peribacillus glennii TaxID=2303991 RepID=UPI001314046D|nr:phosphatase PAP2 family protein [Peribacillus glennii]
MGIVEELRENELVRFDSAIIQFVQGLVSDRLTSAMKVITYFGSKTWLTFATLGISILLVLMHKKRFAVFLLFSSTAGGLFNMLLKWIFKRERPDIYPIIVEHGFSFPSGHSMGSFIFYGALAIILVKISTPVYLDWLFGGFCALIIFLIGLSRIYLGVHYPSDVIAGFAAGGAWLTICGLLFRYGEYLLKKAKESQGIKGSYNK